MLAQRLCAYVSVYSVPLVLGQLTEAGHNYTWGLKKMNQHQSTTDNRVLFLRRVNLYCSNLLL